MKTFSFTCLCIKGAGDFYGEPATVVAGSKQGPILVVVSSWRDEVQRVGVGKHRRGRGLVINDIRPLHSTSFGEAEAKPASVDICLNGKNCYLQS